MLRLTLFILLLLALLGGGVATWINYAELLRFKLTSHNKPPPEEDSASSSYLSPLDGKTPPRLSRYLPLRPVRVTIFEDQRPQQFLTLVLALELVDEAAAVQYEGREQVLGNAILQSLYSTLAERPISKGSTIDLERILADIHAACDKILGANVIQRVLLQGITQRQI